LEAGALHLDELLLPLIFDAKVEICLDTSALSQAGQITPSIELLLRTNSSKWVPQRSHINSNIGIFYILHD
jgi:hypothetical protein